MTTQLLFRDDAYLREAKTQVLGHTPEGGIVVQASVFYATSGGQPGDSGFIYWEGRKLEIATAVRIEGGLIALVPAEAAALPREGVEVVQQIDWTRRHKLMRMHTALHLLSVVIPLPVTGGQIGAERGRLDFMMPEPPVDVAALNTALNALIARDLVVSTSFITDAELEAKPELVKTMSVRPPMGQGQVRLVQIGDIDLQPCGGTHVARTAEIGRVEIGKIENKGKQNRRVNLMLLA
ncbi:alanyl-tRNA editing protein [Cypionkella sp.]|jgi:misacylated tRNA(Ala) deacylase|uniref:alanyl-tRNA editing protein n=1 Tax=Cypionkella sp. TaxID=2811411 RepID=UPI00274BEF05|nr:alanyl-tRNA editing protein [Cypionkella sp.]